MVLEKAENDDNISYGQIEGKNIRLFAILWFGSSPPPPLKQTSMNASMSLLYIGRKTERMGRGGASAACLSWWDPNKTTAKKYRPLS